MHCIWITFWKLHFVEKKKFLGNSLTNFVWMCFNANMQYYNRQFKQEFHNLWGSLGCGFESRLTPVWMCFNANMQYYNRQFKQEFHNLWGSLGCGFESRLTPKKKSKFEGLSFKHILKFTFGRHNCVNYNIHTYTQ